MGRAAGSFNSTIANPVHNRTISTVTTRVHFSTAHRHIEVFFCHCDCPILPVNPAWDDLNEISVTLVVIFHIAMLAM